MLSLGHGYRCAVGEAGRATKPLAPRSFPVLEVQWVLPLAYQPPGSRWEHGLGEESSRLGHTDVVPSLCWTPDGWFAPSQSGQSRCGGYSRYTCGAEPSGPLPERYNLNVWGEGLPAEAALGLALKPLVEAVLP